MPTHLSSVDVDGQPAEARQRDLERRLECEVTALDLVDDVAVAIVVELALEVGPQVAIDGLERDHFTTDQHPHGRPAPTHRARSTPWARRTAMDGARSTSWASRRRRAQEQAPRVAMIETLYALTQAIRDYTLQVVASVPIGHGDPLRAIPTRLGIKGSRIEDQGSRGSSFARCAQGTAGGVLAHRKPT